MVSRKATQHAKHKTLRYTQEQESKAIMDISSLKLESLKIKEIIWTLLVYLLSVIQLKQQLIKNLKKKSEFS